MIEGISCWMAEMLGKLSKFQRKAWWRSISPSLEQNRSGEAKLNQPEAAIDALQEVIELARQTGCPLQNVFAQFYINAKKLR